MMIKNVRILVVSAAVCVLLGSGAAVSAMDPIPVLQSLSAEAGSEGSVIHLRATGDLETVHYSPQPGVWVVEMPEARWEQESGVLSDPELGIERAELIAVEEFGKRVTRLTVWLVKPSQLQLMPTGNGIDLVFSEFAQIDRAMAALVDAPPAEELLSAGADDADVSPGEEVASEPARALFEAAPNAPSGGNLLDVVPVRSGDGLIVELHGDGALVGNAFTLPAPDRLVVDFSGVINRVERNLYAINSDDVRQVRVAQYQSIPAPITRLVVDLNRPADFEVITTAKGAVVTVGGIRAEPVQPTGDVESLPVGNGAGVISIVHSRPAAEEGLSGEQTSEAMLSEPQSDLQPGVSPELPDEIEEEQLVEEAPSVVPSTTVSDERSPWVAEPSQLIEKAPAGEVLASPTAAGDAYDSKEVESEEQQFTGDPITLTLKDADIKDVLRTFSALTQLNIVLDPAVSGSVTVELRDVPWDQALDLILKINNLDYVLENNVLRVAPISRLAQEKAARAAFLAEQEKARPLKTVVKPLSYAKASEVASILKGEAFVLSPRGSVVVDARTNTLIIRDIVDRVEGILRLIDTLDLPTPQVVIEGRIVETTRDFSRELGVSWGFTSIMDVEHGNDTGLRFPSTVDTVGRVGLLRGDVGTLSLGFGDILNTFNLDFLLGAAESDGLVKIVSTPRVTTQNLQRASIRSGLQIPVQTVANNTVTVQYVDATLRLQVTPQITAEGTVNLELNVQKQEPVLGIGVTGATNAPIFTRDAQTQLLVRDGGTTVIAGIYQINDQDNRNSVPGLSKIPIIGRLLFKSRGVFKRHDELLIFITPRIVKY